MNTIPSQPPFQALWPADLQSVAPAPDWLWTGYLTPGNLTLLTSPWKAGKTTLTALLLARLAAGGELAGQVVRAGRAVVVSEENPAQWRQRCERLGLAAHVCFLCRPFQARPDAARWLALIDYLLDLHARHTLSLVVIDPLAEFLPARSENEAGLMLEALLPLRRLTSAGLAVLLLHHPRKKASTEGEAARGSGALSGHADILMELAYFSSPAALDRRRKLFAFSRFDQTPRQVVIELTETADGYVSRGDLPHEEFIRGWEQLREVLAQATEKKSRHDLLAGWPGERWPRPSAASLGRWLEQAVAAGLLRRCGTGSKTDRFLYWLPSQEAVWSAAATQRLDEEEKAMREIFGAEWAAQYRRERAAEVEKEGDAPAERKK